MPRKLFTSLLNPSLKVTEDQLETDVNLIHMERSIATMNRRNFLGALAAAGAGAATIGSAAFPTKAEAQSANSALINILNFALNLEYLEANLYIAVSGAAPISSTDSGGGPAPINVPAVTISDAQTMATFAGLAADELHHIQLLRSTITQNGGTPIAQPQIDYSAGGTLSITTQAQLLTVARQFTAVGNSAYAGAAANFIADPTLLTAAAQILGAEGQHLGAVNYLCVLQNIAPAAVDTLDVPPSASPINFFTATPISTPFTPTQPAPTTGVTPTLLAPTGPANGIQRTTSDVLGIVYGATTPTNNAPPATGVAMGGFFPMGVNGAVTTT